MDCRGPPGVSPDHASGILLDLKEKLEEISSRKDLLPKSDLAQAVGYALNEYNAVCDIFKRGDTALDNNYVERIQRYIVVKKKLPVLWLT